MLINRIFWSWANEQLIFFRRFYSWTRSMSIKNWQNFVTRIVMNIYFDDKLATSNSFPTIKEPFWTKNQEKNQRNMLTIQRMIFVLEFSQLRWDFYFAHQMYKLISPWSCSKKYKNFSGPKLAKMFYIRTFNGLVW